jgi:prevent-host-death family protein
MLSDSTHAHVSTSDLRENFSEHMGRVHHRHERLVVEKNSRPTVALISYEDLELFEALEDRLDALMVDKVLAENGPRITLDEARKRLGL